LIPDSTLENIATRCQSGSTQQHVYNDWYFGLNTFDVYRRMDSATLGEWVSVMLSSQTAYQKKIYTVGGSK